MYLEFPALPGTYALSLWLNEAVELPIGKLGVCRFLAGRYIYLGSARGPGGLRARLKHHLAPLRRPHWHVDWLRAKALPTGGWYVVQQECLAEEPALECRWSRSLLELSGASVPLRGFGASDCLNHCPAHLILLPAGEPGLQELFNRGQTGVVEW